MKAYKHLGNPTLKASC